LDEKEEMSFQLKRHGEGIMGKDMLSIGRHNQSLYFNLSIGKAE
jgi:hypothetical protein